MKSTTFYFLLAASLSTGCTETPSASASLPTDAASQASASQTSAAAASQPGARTVTGTVMEAIDAASYTYLRLNTDGGEIWVATSPLKIAAGERVVAQVEIAMENFHSKTLNRDFALIYFTPDVRREGEQAPPALAVSHSPTGGGAAPPEGQTPAPLPQAVVEPMPPPAGGMSVADVWAKRAELAGKTVTVRGRVVKFNGEIMGTNWLHIQDGTGDAGKGTHDLTITTDAVASVGDIVTATGVLAVDKDFGAGYSYAAIVEGATIVVSRPAGAGPQPSL